MGLVRTSVGTKVSDEIREAAALPLWKRSGGCAPVLLLASEPQLSVLWHLQRVQGSARRLQGSGLRVQGLGSRLQGSGFRVQP